LAQKAAIEVESSGMNISAGNSLYDQ